MSPTTMCTTSICTFVKYVDTSRYATFAFVDNRTDPAVLRMYRSHGVRLLRAYSDGFPRPDRLYPHDRPYVWLKLQIWSMHAFDNVLYFGARCTQAELSVHACGVRSYARESH